MVTCHGSDLAVYPQLALVAPMLRWCMRNADCVVGVSPELCEKAIGMGCDIRRAVVLPSGADTDRFLPRDKQACRRRLGLDPQRPLALCVGSLDENKNQIVLIEAMARLATPSGPPCDLALVGQGPWQDRLAQRAKELGLDRWVRLTGSQPFEDIPYWMGAADWLLLASKREGWPTVYFEAMSCGRPVITSDVAAARHAICTDAYGLIVEPSTPDGFAEAIVKALNRQYDPEVIRDAAMRHSWQSWGQSIQDIMSDLTDPHGKIGEWHDSYANTLSDAWR
jgi:glycosyltransferase involved in cell wall biosynthesis